MKGLKELQRAFKKLQSEAAKEIDRGLLDAGKVVAEDARPRLARYDARSAAGIRARTRGFGSVAVEQSRKRTTGQHPEFGALIMRRALLPALAAKEKEVVEKVDDILDRLAGDAGF